MIIPLLLVIGLFYLLSTTCLVLYLKGRGFRKLQLFRLSLLFAVLGHLLVCGWEFAASSMRAESPSLLAGYMAVTGFVGIVALAMALTKRSLGLLMVILPSLAVGIFSFTFVSEIHKPMPIPSLWLWTHVSLMWLGQIFFFFAASVAVLYLWAEYQLHRRHRFRFLSAISSLPQVEQVLSQLLWLGFLMLSVGLLLGVFFAEQFWEGEWFRDPKVLLTGLTWLVYAGLLLGRVCAAQFYGRSFAIGAVVGFILILLFSFGGKWLMESQHTSLRAGQESEVKRDVLYDWT